MVCLDRDRGAISCCSGGARLPRGLGHRDRGSEEERMAEGQRSPELSPEGDL